MEPALYGTCATIVGNEIIDNCNTFSSRIETLLPLTEDKKIRKLLKKLHKRVKLVQKTADKIWGKLWLIGRNLLHGLVCYYFPFAYGFLESRVY